MIGADHGLDTVADVLFVLVCGKHQAVQILEELVLVEGNGLADVNKFIVGLFQAFLGHELLFKELLAGTKAGVLDLDIHVGLEAGEADEVPGQGVDLHWGAHVEDEDLAAVGIGAGQHDETDGLGDGHEVADDVRMGDGHGTALLNLTLEDGNDRTVGAQDIAKADGDKLGFDVLQAVLEVVVAVGLVPVGEELR